MSKWYFIKPEEYLVLAVIQGMNNEVFNTRFPKYTYHKQSQHTFFASILMY
jgi:hypothetical protein